MKLITEEIHDVQILVEEVNGAKEHYITGIFMQAEKKNKNGRVYPLPVLQKEVSRYNQEYVQKNRAADIVADPSAPDAFVRGIMESAEWILTPHGWSQMELEKAQKLIKEASRSEIEAVALRVFSNFISKL
jgi:hypothetical protein